MDELDELDVEGVAAGAGAIGEPYAVLQMDWGYAIMPSVTVDNGVPN